uniref:ATP synthase complex subunit 8 n=1 Tax=Choroterpides apiculata (nomen nudum) TaxID=2729127 RepID=A0A6M3R5R7_9DIPT|nr:ATP synthase F0 subunit 8 [Choroterpides apiculata (nomen nudum)]
MPQMAPLSWIILYFLFSFTLIIFSSLNFFNYKTNPLNSSSQKIFNTNSLNWKW